MRTTLTLADDVAEAAQSVARATGKTLSEVISELARRGLKQSSRRVRSNKGVPGFAVPADARIIPSDRAAALLGDEP